jgi:hypothetical protein
MIDTLTRFFLPHVDKVLYLVGAIGCCGVTMTTAISRDIVSLLTAHIYVCYAVSRLVFRRQLDIAGALWKLFRGEKICCYELFWLIDCIYREEEKYPPQTNRLLDF